MSRKFVTKALGKLLKTRKTKANYDVKEAKEPDDVIIYVGKESDFKEFHGNSKNLCSKSNYFKKILSSEDIEKKDGKYVIKKQNITPQAFDVIIK